MNGRPWSERELETLEQIAMDHPPDQIVSIYCDWARRHRYSRRTANSIQQKLHILGVSDKATGEWVSAGYLCRLLDISGKRIRRWAEVGGITCHRDRRRRRFLLRSALIEAAHDKPEIYAGISADRLFLLLEDRALADKIAARYPWHGAQCKRVRMIETGRCYPSIFAAAQSVGISHRAITYSIQKGSAAAGYHWTFA